MITTNRSGVAPTAAFLWKVMASTASTSFRKQWHLHPFLQPCFFFINLGLVTSPGFPNWKYVQENNWCTVADSGCVMVGSEKPPVSRCGEPVCTDLRLLFNYWLFTNSAALTGIIINNNVAKLTNYKSWCRKMTSTEWNPPSRLGNWKAGLFYIVMLSLTEGCSCIRAKITHFKLIYCLFLIQ